MESAKVAIVKDSDNETLMPLRTGKYFYKSYLLDNSSASVSETFKVYASGDDKVAQQDIDVFLPKNPVVPTYDPDGNLLTDGKHSYTWNGENRLIAVEKSDDYKLEFKYDFMGRRIEKKVYSWTGSAWQLDKTEKLAWSKWNQVATFSGSTAGEPPVTSYGLSKSNLWAVDLSGSLQGAGGVGGLLAVTDHVGAKSYLPCYDGNGNVMAYCDSSDGAVKAEYEYSPFGKTIVKSGSMADGFEYRFSTKPYDNETGLVLYQLRGYNPVTGRFLNRDPLEEMGGVNVYGFVGNDSVGRWDKLGLEWKVERFSDHNWALAYSTGDNDNLKGLAKKLLLEERQALGEDGWLKIKEGARRITVNKFDKYQCYLVPNLIAYYKGPKEDAVDASYRIVEGLNFPPLIRFRGLAERPLEGLKNAGFNVVAVSPFKKSFIDLWEYDGIFGVFFLGHGHAANLGTGKRQYIGFNAPGFVYPNDVTPRYRLGLVAGYSCYSAENAYSYTLGTNGKLTMKAREGMWIQHTSLNGGVFLGFTGGVDALDMHLRQVGKNIQNMQKLYSK